MQSVIRRLQRGNSIEIPAATALPPYLPGKSVSPRCSLSTSEGGRAGGRWGRRKEGRFFSSSSHEARNESPTKHVASQCIVNAYTPETAARSDPPFVRASGSLASLLPWMKIFRINPAVTLCTPGNRRDDFRCQPRLHRSRYLRYYRYSICPIFSIGPIKNGQQAREVSRIRVIRTVFCCR